MKTMFVKKMTYLCFSTFVFLLIVGIVVSIEKNRCMGIPMISEKELVGYVETSEFDISHIKFSGEDIAVDFPNNTVFVSQPVEAVRNMNTLIGNLETTNPTVSLAMLRTDEISNLRETVQKNFPLTLVIRSENLYQKVNLLITTLPIMYLDFESESEDEQGRKLNIGKMTVWNNLETPSNLRTVVSNAEWRLRGNSTRSFDKKAWKMNLRNENYQNKNVDLLGLGSDDDWILNPMSMDDTFIKEKLVQELWEQYVQEKKYNYPMSQGEYVELIINGAYQGLYLLQRRIDSKYLKLDKERDILMKGINTWEAESYQEAYEIVSSPYGEKITYELFEKAMNYEKGYTINENNFIDVSLLLQLISGTDNYGYKNTFYVLKQKEDMQELYFVPWDTDLSFGVTWGYDYEDSMTEIIERYELPIVKQHVEDVDEKIADRWHELRENIFSRENIMVICENFKNELKISGALERDIEKWGFLHEGEDNWDNLDKFICERLVFLDEYYENIKK